MTRPPTTDAGRPDSGRHGRPQGTPAAAEVHLAATAVWAASDADRNPRHPSAEHRDDKTRSSEHKSGYEPDKPPSDPIDRLLKINP